MLTREEHSNLWNIHLGLLLFFALAFGSSFYSGQLSTGAELSSLESTLAELALIFYLITTGILIVSVHYIKSLLPKVEPFKPIAIGERAKGRWDK